MKEQKFEITDIQLFDYAYERQIGETEYEMVYSYSANIAINNNFMIQLSGDFDISSENIPCSDTAAWNSDEKQDYACKHYDVKEIMERLDIENNIGWLEDHATDVMNPENVKYRINVGGA